MISGLQIRNYRHNEKLDVDLDRITVFRGPSGSGKSSLLGALKWVVFNRPSGNNFIHWDHKFVAVRLHADSHTVTRKRSKRENTYQLDKQKYVAFGSTVPEKITSVLNVTPLNFQRQHAGPFWFRETAGEVSRQLNTIVNLELIDTTLSNIAKEERTHKWRVTLTKEHIEKAKKEKQKLRWIITFDKKLRVLEKEEKECEALAKRIRMLETMLEETKQYKKVASRTVPNIKPLLKLHEECEETKTRIEAITQLLCAADDCKGHIEVYEKQIKENKRKLKRLIGKQCPLCGSQVKTKI